MVVNFNSIFIPHHIYTLKRLKDIKAHDRKKKSQTQKSAVKIVKKKEKKKLLAKTTSQFAKN